MARPKMLILRGNSADAGSYPDEQGKTIAWPIGALHVQAASAYAQRRGYEAVVLPVAGQPQSQHSPQAKAALKAFLDPKDQTVTALYGFSGGGYNVKHILDSLARNEPPSLRRITLVVVLGAPNEQGGKNVYKPSNYSKDAAWDVVYRTNPKQSQMPKGLPNGTGTHMFGPDVLLAGWPEKN
jgi:hypothetical protein